MSDRHSDASLSERLEREKADAWNTVKIPLHQRTQLLPVEACSNHDYEPLNVCTRCGATEDIKDYE